MSLSSSFSVTVSASNFLFMVWSKRSISFVAVHADAPPIRTMTITRENEVRVPITNLLQKASIQCTEEVADFQSVDRETALGMRRLRGNVASSPFCSHRNN